MHPNPDTQPPAQVFVCLIAIELFGSPFARNANLVAALLAGYAIAAVAGPFVEWAAVADAPWLTFLWARTFPLSAYPLCTRQVPT